MIGLAHAGVLKPLHQEIVDGARQGVPQLFYKKESQILAQTKEEIREFEG